MSNDSMSYLFFYGLVTVNFQIPLDGTGFFLPGKSLLFGQPSALFTITSAEPMLHAECPSIRVSDYSDFGKVLCKTP